MKLFVGLGNPGANYALNRHNIGFMVMDQIANDHSFGPWRDKFKGQLCEGKLNSKKVLLLKPATFMNLSGQSVEATAHFYKLKSDQITVFHDELDLVPNKLRIKQGGGHAGHNGLRSIHSHVGSDYVRVRLGIGHPGQKDLVAKYVLHNFSKAEQNQLALLLEGISDGISQLVDDKPSEFMNAVALKNQHPNPSGTSKIKNMKDDAHILQPDVRNPLQRLLDKFK
jgi:PTH1 family peptidyl-tRNA hydrolase